MAKRGEGVGSELIIFSSIFVWGGGKGGGGLNYSEIYFF